MGNVIKNIHVADIQIDRVDDHAVSIVSEYVDKYTGNQRTCYREFELLNIHCNYAANGFVLEGSEQFPLENIVFANVVVDEAPVECTGKKYTGNLLFRNVYMNGKEISCSSL